MISRQVLRHCREICPSRQAKRDSRFRKANVSKADYARFKAELQLETALLRSIEQLRGRQRIR